MNNTIEQGLLRRLVQYAHELPEFPDGRINYSSAWEAPVVDVFVCVKDKFLILKRSLEVRMYKEKWHVVGGYIDQLVPLSEIVEHELEHEIGLENRLIRDLVFLPEVNFYDQIARFQWYIYPVILELDERPDIILDWEHTESTWISSDDIDAFDTVPGLDTIFEYVVSDRATTKKGLLPTSNQGTN